PAAPTRPSYSPPPAFMILNPATFSPTMGDADDYQWMLDNIPLFDSPDSTFNAVYYFRWQNFRKHIKAVPETYRYVITEFWQPVSWGTKYQTINAAAGHHVREGRWLWTPDFVDGYLTFWMKDPGATPRNYSFWAADTYWNRYLVDADKDFLIGFENALIANYNGWSETHFDLQKGLFWQVPISDGMECELTALESGQGCFGGQGYRPTINSYMYGDAIAIQKIAQLAGDPDTANTFAAKAAALKAKLQSQLWDSSMGFFVDVRRDTNAFVDGREEMGYVPWYFDLPDGDYASAWHYLMDPNYFYTPYGPTTLERGHRLFVTTNATTNPTGNNWNGPSWPYATSQTLTAMANLLDDYRQSVVNSADYFHLLTIYTKSQFKDGQPALEEQLDPLDGSWPVGFARSPWYNHSTYADLIITGLVGLRPRADNTVQVSPLLPDNTWDYFALDRVPYHGHSLTILWDRTGEHYHRGQGLQVFADGTRIAAAPTLSSVSGTLPSAPPPTPAPRTNLALNTKGSGYPEPSASFTYGADSVWQAVDGVFAYTIDQPRNRWTSFSSGNLSDWFAVDFGTAQSIDTIEIYPYDDDGGVQTPTSYDVQYWDGTNWIDAPNQIKTAPPAPILADRFNAVTTQKVRVLFTQQPGTFSGLTEIEVYGGSTNPTPLPAVPHQPGIVNYEAESAAVNDAPNAASDSASGASYVGPLANADSAVKFTVVVPQTGDYQMKVFYANGNGVPATQNVSVNGGAATPLTYPGNGIWGRFLSSQFVLMPIKLNAGSNEILFTSGDQSVELDTIWLMPVSSK
ncbi:MAG TPA: discoidin domain-containing protein, partial [Aggregatilineales bacterium]|nr:discoidin domain-containing protein [Aggregatilineales bacterium]